MKSTAHTFDLVKIMETMNYLGHLVDLQVMKFKTLEVKFKI